MRFECESMCCICYVMHVACIQQNVCVCVCVRVRVCVCEKGESDIKNFYIACARTEVCGLQDASFPHQRGKAGGKGRREHERVIHDLVFISVLVGEVMRQGKKKRSSYLRNTRHIANNIHTPLTLASAHACTHTATRLHTSTCTSVTHSICNLFLFETARERARERENQR
jgi:hypothetical protein